MIDRVRDYLSDVFGDNCLNWATIWNVNTFAVRLINELLDYRITLLQYWY